ncbi:hypothetical protein VNO77_04259 [Canavalia gladiata]|uniref:Uncharacterized protein n=1 Tax=Canavalia gladiata TaxID=3824 RepID=A0AAN9MW72_CANGL
MCSGSWKIHPALPICNDRLMNGLGLDGAALLHTCGALAHVVAQECVTGLGIEGKGISRGRPENKRVSGFSGATVGSREQGLIDIALRIPSSHTSRKGTEFIEIHCPS